MSNLETPAPRRTGRRPGVSNSREKILTAARTRFSAEGFTETTIRAIAMEAGVDGALVMRFFGSKDKLFVAAMSLPQGFTDRFEAVLEGDPSTYGERLVRTYLQIWDDPEAAEPLLAMLRSSLTTDKTADLLRDFLESRISSVIAPQLAAPDAPLRVALVVSQLLGITLAAKVVKIADVLEADTETLVTMLAPSIQSTLVPGPPE